MLSRVLSQVPSGKDEGKNREAELHTLHIQIGGISFSMREDNQGGEFRIPSPQGKKRAASDDPETMASKRGEKSSSEGPTPGRSSAELCPQRDHPSSEP